MTEDLNKLPKIEQKPKRRHKVLFTIFLLFLGLFLSKEISARINYALLVDDLINAKTEITKQTDVIAERDIYGRGDGSISLLLCLPDVSCPFVDGLVLAAIEPGKELEFMKNIAEEQGYHNISSKFTKDCDLLDKEYLSYGLDCEISAYNSHKQIQISISTNYNRVSYYKDITPKVWRKVYIEVRP